MRSLTIRLTLAFLAISLVGAALAARRAPQASKSSTAVAWHPT